MRRILLVLAVAAIAVVMTALAGPALAFTGYFTNPEQAQDCNGITQTGGQGGEFLNHGQWAAGVVPLAHEQLEDDAVRSINWTANCGDNSIPQEQPPNNGVPSE